MIAGVKIVELREVSDGKIGEELDGSGQGIWMF